MQKPISLLDINNRLDAQEFVLKVMINVMSQMAPNSGMQAAMHQMLENSVKAASITGGDDPSQGEQVRQNVLQHGKQIIDAAFGARPANPSR